MLRDNARRAEQALLVLVLAAVNAICLSVVDAYALTLSDWSLVESGLASPSTWAVFTVRLLLMLSSFALIIATYVFLIRWLRRAYYNLHQLPGVNPEYPEGWAAGAWFVPFINLVRPLTIMREVWRDTQRAAFGQEKVAATLLGWWWAAHLADAFVGNILFRLSLKADTAGSTEELRGEIIGEILNLAHAVLTWLVVRDVASFERDLHERVRLGELGQEASPPVLAEAGQADYQLEEGY